MGKRSKKKAQKSQKSKPRATQVAKPADARWVRASYDAARTSDDFSNYWANADRYDADSANSRDVRHTLISRSRYEIGNNGYADGIAQTYATDLIGVGPMLRMQTGSVAMNQLIELVWQRWARAISLRSKLWTTAHAKHSDGEGIGIVRRNPAVRHRIKLDVVLVEAEQCQTPWLPYEESGYIDGLRFDDFGNPVYYEFLKNHPGSNTSVSIASETEKVPADFVLHWFRRRRPGQHRGVPESASTLNVGAAARRWREATIAAAETAADFSVLLKTTMTPEEAELVAPMSTLEIEKRMMTALPDGYDPTQMKAEHPTATYEAFNKALINEQARPKSMPYNKAACDSSAYNYASGRLDHQTYYGSLDVERSDCEEQFLDKLFDVWLMEAVASYGWFGGNRETINSAGLNHGWDWPKHQVADIKAEASANQTKLTSGQVGLHRLYSDSGLDLEDEIPEMARTYGVGEEEIRKRLLDIVLPPRPASAGVDSSPLNGRLAKLNGNGALHVN